MKVSRRLSYEAGAGALLAVLAFSKSQIKKNLPHVLIAES